MYEHNKCLYVRCHLIHSYFVSGIFVFSGHESTSPHLWSAGLACGLCELRAVERGNRITSFGLVFILFYLKKSLNENEVAPKSEPPEADS